MQQALDILKKYWQHDAFREPQEAVIHAVLENKDTFVLMPTGGGKSVCFQVPALMGDGLCLVISPLIALMKDQVAALGRRGIKAIALTGSIHPDEVSNLLDNCKFGNYKFLYLSPERLVIFDDRVSDCDQHGHELCRCGVCRSGDGFAAG